MGFMISRALPSDSDTPSSLAASSTFLARSVKVRKRDLTIVSFVLDQC